MPWLLHVVAAEQVGNCTISAPAGGSVVPYATETSPAPASLTAYTENVYVKDAFRLLAVKIESVTG